jgi:hypothetical protein
MVIGPPMARLVKKSGACHSFIFFSICYPLSWRVCLLALGLLSSVAYSQNARINQYLNRVERLRRARRWLARAMAPLGIPTLLGLIVAVASRLYLSIFDRLFLHYGRIGRRSRPTVNR